MVARNLNNQKLRGELKIESVESSSRFGKMFEARVIQECFRISDYERLDLKFSYWKSSTSEVDLVVSRGAGEPLAAIEIKSSTAPEEHHLKSLARFSQDYPDVPLYCLSQTPRQYMMGKVKVLPFSELAGVLRGI